MLILLIRVHSSRERACWHIIFNGPFNWWHWDIWDAAVI